MVRALKNFNFAQKQEVSTKTKKGGEIIASFGYFAKHDPTLIKAMINGY
ncbi:hypothetical protein HMPREF1430_00019 [Helicobacter pylori GAM96Ai]|nr:hypothetical protein HMPREF1430_00019 [Helicobacter pylori GAM96Ai]